VRLRALSWDSDFFGLRIARLEETELAPEDVHALEDAVRAQGLDCVYFLAGEEVAPERAAAAGFQAVDERVTLELRPLSPAAAPHPGVRPAAPGDESALEDIAGEAHRDTRFFADARFPRQRSVDLYRTWIRNSLHGGADAVLVAGDGSDPAGYATAHLRPGGLGEIGLVGVAARARGRGRGRALVLAVVEWLRDRGCTRVQVVTQGRNAAALELYRRAGFHIVRRQTWYHRWGDRPG